MVGDNPVHEGTGQMTSTISETAEAFNCARMPEVASALSSATTSSQLVPALWWQETLFPHRQRARRAVYRFQRRKMHFDGLAKRFQRQSRIVGGNHAAITVQEQPLLFGGGLDTRTLATTLSIDITRHHRFQRTIFFHRYGEGHHQFPGACINRCGDYRASVLTTC
jgi:hypothetical protein